MKNKIEQTARREIRGFVTAQFSIINEVIRPQPKWCPNWLWKWGANIFIDSKKLGDYLVNGIPPKIQRQKMSTE